MALIKIWNTMFWFWFFLAVLIVPIVIVGILAVRQFRYYLWKKNCVRGVKYYLYEIPFRYHRFVFSDLDWDESEDDEGYFFTQNTL